MTTDRALSKGAGFDAQRIVGQVAETVFEIEHITRQLLVAIVSGGHVLLEGNPGVGKTTMVKTLAEALGLGFGRIQFTPDLMPADITGTVLPMGEQGSWIFQPGPIFTNLLLADEINRATPKTQSAMLEAMAESQVTVLGETHPLDPPFVVLATQNPIEHEGTYELPRAQLDRFMFKVFVPNPGETTLRAIVRAPGATEAAPRTPPVAFEATPARSPAPDIAAMRRRVARHEVLPAVEEHALNIVLATNRQPLISPTKASQATVTQLVDELEFGLGPRAAQALLGCARAHSVLFGSDDQDEAAGPEALAQIAVPALLHRVVPRFDWESRLASLLGAGEPRVMLESFVEQLVLATVPDASGSAYRGFLEEALAAARAERDAR